MPMIAGAVTIDPASGTAAGMGLAKDIYDPLAAALSIPSGVLPTDQAKAKQQIAALANAIAQKVVAHIASNATIVVAAGIPVATAGSAAAQTGATTGPGTATIS